MQHDPHPRNVRQPGWASDSKPPLFSWSQASLTSSCSKKQFGSNWSWQESEHQMLRVLLVVAPIEAFGLVNIKHTLLRMSQPNWPHSFSQVRVWHWLNHINITHIPRLKAYCKPCFVLVISSHQLLSGVARTYIFQVFPCVFPTLFHDFCSHSISGSQPQLPGQCPSLPPSNPSPSLHSSRWAQTHRRWHLANPGTKQGWNFWTFGLAYLC